MRTMLNTIRDHLNPIIAAVFISGTVTAVINASMVLLLRVCMDIELSVMTPHDVQPRPVHWRQLIPESFVMPLVGVILFLFLKSYTRRAWPWFVFLVAVITAVWSVGPVMQGTGVASKVFLTMTHCVIALSMLLIVRFYLERRLGSAPSRLE